MQSPNDFLRQVVHNVRQLIRAAEIHFIQRRGPNVPIYALMHWDAWFQIHLEHMRTMVHDWAKKYLEMLEIHPEVRNDPQRYARVQSLLNSVNALPDINTHNFYPQLP